MKNNHSPQTKPIMRVFSKGKFRQLAHKYEFTTTMIKDIVRNAKNMDVLVLQTQFREGKHWVDNAWVLNEGSPEVFMELMFGKKKENKTADTSMKDEEFNLSEKERIGYFKEKGLSGDFKVVLSQDIKQFIKVLKYKVKGLELDEIKGLYFIIDKLAGEKLK